MSKYQYTVNGVDYDVEIEETGESTAKVTVNGIAFDVQTKQRPAVSNAHKRTPVVRPPQPAPSSIAPATTKPQASPASLPAGTHITAPLPGTITEVNVRVGDTVKAGDTLIVLEAMKMQNNIEADTSGTVSAVRVSKGDSVLEGTVLVVIE